MEPHASQRITHTRVDKQVLVAREGRAYGSSARYLRGAAGASAPIPFKLRATYTKVSRHRTTRTSGLDETHRCQGYTGRARWHSHTCTSRPEVEWTLRTGTGRHVTDERNRVLRVNGATARTRDKEVPQVSSQPIFRLRFLSATAIFLPRFVVSGGW